MPPAVTVVINCAGSGRRLGRDTCKCLIEVGGRRLIDRLLDVVQHIDHLRIVIGYQAAAVIKAVTARRRDAIFVFNHDFASTGTGDSLLKACHGVRGDVISLDGDLLIGRTEFEKLLEMPGPVLGVSSRLSDEPVFVQVAEPIGAIAFSRTVESSLEWTGLARLPAEWLNEVAAGVSPPRHVFQLIEPLLPLPILPIVARDIDTPADLAAAEAMLDARSL